MFKLTVLADQIYEILPILNLSYIFTEKKIRKVSDNKLILLFNKKKTDEQLNNYEFNVYIFCILIFTEFSNRQNLIFSSIVNIAYIFMVHHIKTISS